MTMECLILYKCCKKYEKISQVRESNPGCQHEKVLLDPHALPTELYGLEIELS